MARKAIGKAINVKVPPASLVKWRSVARAVGVDLSSWIRCVCDQAASAQVVETYSSLVEPRESSAKQQAVRDFMAGR